MTADGRNNKTSTLVGDGLPPLRQVIERHGLSAKKSLGQNFLLDLNLTRKIARLGGDLVQHTVIEVGPGPGGLTRALLMEGAAKVVAIERDVRCLPALAAISDAYPGRLEVIEGDALKADWRALTGEGAGPITIAANLPYGIASLLLVNWLEEEPWPPWFDQMVLMFQKEVAERIVAVPRTKAYGRLSVLAQWRTEAKVVLALPPEAFTPAPKVASAVVRLRPILRPEPKCSVAMLARVTAAAFGQRRKMLRSSLRQLTPMPELLLREAEIAGERRAEDLSVDEFARLASIMDRTTSEASQREPVSG